MEAKTTSWELLEAAANGNIERRSEFADLYGGMIREFLECLWRGSPLHAHMDDAVQDVFLECFKPNGALQRADRSHPRGFRVYLRGVIRNVARRYAKQAGRAQAALPPEAPPQQQTTGSKILDREWARAIVREAASRMRAHAEEHGAGARRRVELLRLRFEEDLPIREIARRWQEDAAALHHAYARARLEYREHLMALVARHFPGSRADVERECEELIRMLE